MTGSNLISHFATLAGRHRTVDACRRNTARTERIHLIFHQRDQRRNDDRQTILTECRDLVAERLAASRGKHNDAILIAQHAFHRLTLQGTKIVVTPVVLDRLGELFVTSCRLHGWARKQKSERISKSDNPRSLENLESHDSDQKSPVVSSRFPEKIRTAAFVSEGGLHDHRLRVRPEN